MPELGVYYEYEFLYYEKPIQDYTVKQELNKLGQAGYKVVHVSEDAAQIRFWLSRAVPLPMPRPASPPKTSTH